MNVKEFRNKFPEYKDMTDTELSSALHAKHYSDMPKQDFDLMFIGRPTHDNLDTAAVRAVDSLHLQDIDPKIKPVIVGTNKEILSLKRSGKIPATREIVIMPNNTAYVIDPKGVQAIYGGSLSGAVKMAKIDIRKGNVSHLLGYPEKSEQAVDIAVNKQGDVLTELPRISDESKLGNIAYAAEGSPEEAIQKANSVSQAIRLKTPRKWKEIENEGNDQEWEGQAVNRNAETDEGAESYRRQGEEVNDLQPGETQVGLIPAVLYNGQQLTGGDSHDDILSVHNMNMDEGVRGFQNPQGKFLSRSGGMSWIKDNQPDIHRRLMNEDVKELHSQDLRRVYA